MSSDLVAALDRFFEASVDPVLFTGAGVSCAAGLPTWTGLLEKLANFLQRDATLYKQIMLDELRKGNYTKAADLFELSDAPEGDKRRHIKDILSCYDPAPLEGLVKLPCNTWLTTNFDKSLLDAIARVRGVSATDYRYGDISFREATWDSGLFVARIHGAVENPDSIVLSEAKFKKLLADEVYRELLGQIFSQRNVLFIGFSFYDPAIKHVFEEIERIHGPGTPGRHFALLPDGVDSDFLRKASRLNITVTHYSPEDGHRELWEVINSYRCGSKKAPGESNHANSSAKRYLAACYARSATVGSSRALRESVMESIVAGVLQEVSPRAFSKKEIIERVREVVGIKKSDSEDLVERSLLTLTEGNLIRRMKSDRIVNFAWKDQAGPTSLAADISYLCESLEARLKVEEGWSIRPDVREALPKIFEHLIQVRGWDLGAAFASGRPPELVDVEGLVAHPSFRFAAYDQERLARALLSMIQRPTKKEGKLLADMGRAAFAIEMAFQAPRTIFLHGAILPQRVYLDASVVLPAIVPGHPFAEAYSSAILRLKQAAASSAIDLKIRVTKSYLNEIISHRRKAQQFAEESGAKVAQLALSDALYNGAENTNVFIGAYANFVNGGDSELGFDEFVRRYAPYKTESDLEAYLKKRGFDIVDLGPSARSAQILNLLEREYAGALVRNKLPVLIRHDALQLAALEEDLRHGHRAVFVSADRQLRGIVSRHFNAALADSMMSHVGLIQFIEIMLGGVNESGGLTQLIWSTRQSDQQASIRAYLVNKALSKYNAALLMSMPGIVEELAAHIEREMERLGQSLTSEDPRAKVKAFAALGAYETNFFQRMSEEVKKIEAKLG